MISISEKEKHYVPGKQGDYLGQYGIRRAPLGRGFPIQCPPASQTRPGIPWLT